ncbi:hypothetical protein PROFUN_15330 [Planoprotostelium fungivorum]|uniref:Uncharacterized protein n=1 Tax=Planoprotostelium fungivorum TaxID=1890364 RepID=A0A2P6MWZ7_9EUKA|nr:hypothetical protein PROFUN_15330 [Planoprotostelium fungivorum]
MSIKVWDKLWIERVEKKARVLPELGGAQKRRGVIGHTFNRPVYLGELVTHILVDFVLLKHYRSIQTDKYSSSIPTVGGDVRAEWTVGSGMVTAAMKLKRQDMQKYSPELRKNTFYKL